MSAVDTKKMNRHCDSFELLNQLCFSELGNNNVSIILWIDNPDPIHNKQIVKRPKNATWGVETQLGWICAGKTDLITDDCNPDQFTQLNSHPNNGNSMFKLVSKNDKGALDILGSTTELADSHYEIGLIWKGNADLTKSRGLAKKELHQHNNKLSNNPESKQKYEETLK